MGQDGSMPTPGQPKATPSFHISVTIDATFGSEIQRDVSMKVLKQFLAAWMENVKSAHKKNHVAVTVNEGAAPDIIQ